MSSEMAVFQCKNSNKKTVLNSSGVSLLRKRLERNGEMIIALMFLAYRFCIRLYIKKKRGGGRTQILSFISDRIIL